MDGQAQDRARALRGADVGERLPGTDADGGVVESRRLERDRALADLRQRLRSGGAQGSPGEVELGGHGVPAPIGAHLQGQAVEVLRADVGRQREWQREDDRLVAPGEVVAHQGAALGALQARVALAHGDGLGDAVGPDELEQLGVVGGELEPLDLQAREALVERGRGDLRGARLVHRRRDVPVAPLPGGALDRRGGGSRCALRRRPHPDRAVDRGVAGGLGVDRRARDGYDVRPELRPACGGDAIGRGGRLLLAHIGGNGAEARRGRHEPGQRQLLVGLHAGHGHPRQRIDEHRGRAEQQQVHPPAGEAPAREAPRQPGFRRAHSGPSGATTTAAGG